jgi:microcin C transport system substrate-binding protein
MSRFGARTAIALALGVIVALPVAARAELQHGLSLFGDLKYGPDFTHFEYVDPNAPKGGLLHLAAVDSFSTLNPFTLKGETAAGAGLPFESLLTGSADEADSSYGLIASHVELAPDRSWVRFVMRPEARWHDGTPITADDVVYSFDTLLADGHPIFRIQYAGVERVERIADREVTFYFSDLTNRKLPQLVGGMPIISKAYYESHPFTETTMEPPLGSGPYRVGTIDPGRAITYERDEDYWGAALPVNVGRNNFGEIRFDYYRDRTVMVEALKAGEFDFHEEFTSKTWVTAYDLSEIDEGWLVKETLPDNTPSGVQAYFINTRLSKFQDRRVREALSYVFDYEWLNKNLFYGLYDRMASYFENSELAARGLPSEAELVFLEPHRGAIPDEVFTKEFTPPKTDGSGNNRSNLRAARKLFEEAGWVLQEGTLVNSATGEPMEIEFLYFEPSFERVIAPFARNLKRVGIEAKLRLVDGPQYQRRLEEHDFDITTRRFVLDLSPGAELNAYFASDSADRIGSLNSSGVEDPAVDALIGEILAATNRPTLVAATRALDRVLLWNHYMIPQWFKGVHHVIYWNKYGRPAIKPKYARGVADTWWVDPDKDAKLTAYRRGLN